MDTTDVIIGGALVLVVGRQLRGTFLEHLHADRSSTGRELARLAAGVASVTPLGAVGAASLGDGVGASGAGWAGRARWAVSVGVRLAFFLWLYDVTDGAALSPFAFAQDVVGGTVWQPVLTVLGLSEVVARVGASAVRAVTAREHRVVDGPAVPVQES